jgi:putative heme-binding domain-containing protein
VQCHRIGGVGGLVGPDLTSIGAQAPADYLFEALLNPAAKVKEGYNAKVVKTENDEVLAGIPIRESDDQVVLRLADGKEVAIDKSDITDIKDSRSLMPDGLLDSLSEEEAVDLLRFILEMGRIDGKMLVAEDGSIRNWESLGWTEKALVLFNRTSLDSIVGDQSVFTWQSLPALVSGEAPVRGLATFRPHPGVPNYTFLRTSLNVARAGDLAIDLGENRVWRRSELAFRRCQPRFGRRRCGACQSRHRGLDRKDRSVGRSRFVVIRQQFNARSSCSSEAGRLSFRSGKFRPSGRN